MLFDIALVVFAFVIEWRSFSKEYDAQQEAKREERRRRQQQQGIFID